MDALQFLKAEHDNVKAALKEIEQAPTSKITGARVQGGGTREQLWSQLKPDLEAHEQMEDAVLYGPLARQAATQELVTWRWEHEADVRKVGEAIKTLDTSSTEEPDWSDTLRELRTSLEAHIRQEEQDIFPRIRECWDESRLERAGHEMQRMKAQGSSLTGASTRGSRNGTDAATGDTLLSSVSAGIGSLKENLYEYIRQQPGTALGSAVMVGLLLGLALAARRG